MSYFHQLDQAYSLRRQRRGGWFMYLQGFWSNG